MLLHDLQNVTCLDQEKLQVVRRPAKLSEPHEQVPDEQQHARYDGMRGAILRHVEKCRHGGYAEQRRS